MSKHRMFPKHLEKADKMYFEGVITQTAHGTFHCQIENGMTVLAQARKLEKQKVKILMGDHVVVEIDPANIAHTPLRGRIIWRI